VMLESGAGCALLAVGAPNHNPYCGQCARLASPGPGTNNGVGPGVRIEHFGFLFSIAHLKTGKNFR
jgi:hypothetical protein